MISVAVQFLEDSPVLKEISPRAARDRLREACSLLPVSRLALGWNIPSTLLDAVAEETARLGIGLYRWQPLLTGDGMLFPPPEWQTVGVDGRRVPGFRDLPAFTFMCPNKPALREAVYAHLLEVSAPPFQGVFLDRIRFPSPTAHPFSHLACFCEDCCRAAWEEEGLDLKEFQRVLRTFLSAPEAARCLAASLLGNFLPDLPGEVAEGLRAFFRFRKKSIVNFVRLATETASARGMEIGLDCFSPGLAVMVGQDLGALSQVCDWVKVMTYAHAWGPAGLPYEFMGLASFLNQNAGMDEAGALVFLQKQAKLALPGTFQDLRVQGLPSAALVSELRRGRGLGVRSLYAGLELVEIPDVCKLSAEQIRQDWSAVLETGVEGVALSWDLWHMPLGYLRLVSDILEKYS
jgi:hypothetical protein